MNTILAILIVASTGAGAIGTPALGTLTSTSSSVQTTWNDVHQYIAAHATRTDSVTEALLQAEAEAGVKTWVTFTGTDGTSLRSSSPLDGPGLGWPPVECVVLFPTDAETAIAAAMILDVTYGGTHSAASASLTTLRGNGKEGRVR